MKYEFSARGHKNISASHKTTLEFTKDKELTKKGDCIIAVNADFELQQLKRFLNCSKVKITITAAGAAAQITETVTAIPNPSFSSSHELVIRKTDFCSERTFAIKADKAANELDRKLVEALKASARIGIEVEAGF